MHGGIIKRTKWVTCVGIVYDHAVFNQIFIPLSHYAAMLSHVILVTIDVFIAIVFW